MHNHSEEISEYLASEYFTFMLNNRIRLREFVGKFQVVLTKPRNNTNEVLALCDEFNQFRMSALPRDKLKELDEKEVDRLDGALLGRLNGFSLEVILKHECYEHMRSLEEMPLAIPNGPVLIRGLVM